MRIDQTKPATRKKILPDHRLHQFGLAGAARTEHMDVAGTLFWAQAERFAAARCSDGKHDQRFSKRSAILLRIATSICASSPRSSSVILSSPPQPSMKAFLSA